jgi:uncharacterized protein YodC (DUF2158 family)
MKEEIKLGDTVHLNSGSPALLVTAITDEHVKVEWFNENNELQTHVFPSACLHK